MNWLEDTPSSIRECLKRLDIDGDLELALTTDVGPDGQHGERWLAATGKRVFVFSPDREELTADEAEEEPRFCPWCGGNEGR